ncbi:hypothetical protein NIES2101_42330 [Calothrix sp. HK-06]|nr:hypothetical protein NIES2101_42330 [Calothrix sp. HK-06]
MIPLAFGIAAVFAAIAVANEMSVDSQRHRHIKSFQRGKKSQEEAIEHINEAYFQDMVRRDMTDAEYHRMEANWEKMRKTALNNYHNGKGVSREQQLDAIRNQTIPAFNAGKITHEQLYNNLEYIRKARKS